MDNNLALDTMALEVKKAFQPSPEQAAFFNWCRNGTGSAIVEAVAGSGKTTTLLQALEIMLCFGKVFMGAYNKDIAKEIKERALPHPNLFVQTFHAAGLSAWRKAYPNVEVDGKKCQSMYIAKANAAEMAYGPGSPEGLEAKLNMMQVMEQVLALVSYAKQAAFGILKQNSDVQAWKDLIDHFSVDCLGKDEYVITLAQTLYKESAGACGKIIDFDDMILAPLLHKAKFWQYDWVLVDEGQDTNAARRLMALRMLKARGRLVAVGDQHQAIYGFTGADSNSLDLIAKEVNAKRFPLSVSYRCPKSVVAYVQQWVSHIQPHPNAIEGVVAVSTGKEVRATVQPGDAILCRFNAPLVTLVYSLIAEGKPAKIKGREIGNNLKQLATRWKVKSYDQYLEKLEEFCAREVEKARDKDDEAKADQVLDRVDCIKVVVGRARRLRADATDIGQAIADEIESIFQDEIGGKYITLSSIHRSKGLEFDNVYWMRCPVTRRMQDWEHEQERNLNYVAGTRAKKMLVVFDQPKRGEQPQE